MFEEVIVSLRQASWDLVTAAWSLAPRAVAAAVITLLGWLAARLVGWATRRVLSWVPVDRLSERVSLADALRLAELPPASRLVAGAVFWLVWLVFLAEAVDILRLPGFEQTRGELVAFLARLARAVGIVVIGIFAASVIWRATLLAAFNAGLPAARLMAAALRVLVVAIAVLTALAHLGIPMVIVLTAFSIAFSAMMLGLALAFGLGGRDAARDLIARQVRPTRPSEERSQQHL